MADAKQQIRRELHPQLRTLWQQHPMLKEQRNGKNESETLAERFANEYARCGFRFVPLVPLSSHAMCALDITILRRDEPHSIVNAAGDLDGRVKTLLDGLQMPRQCSEMGTPVPAPEPHEDPFYVLMEDDRQIYELNVTTDRLLIPPIENEPHRDILAVILVKTTDMSGNPFSIYRI